jgi:hypothetical protein
MGRSRERWAYNPLRTQRFHGVSSGNPHPYLLKSRYGKVALSLPAMRASPLIYLLCCSDKAMSVSASTGRLGRDRLDRARVWCSSRERAVLCASRHTMSTKKLFPVCVARHHIPAFLVSRLTLVFEIPLTIRSRRGRLRPSDVWVPT